jgi:hypothetical protein
MAMQRSMRNQAPPLDLKSDAMKTIAFRDVIIFPIFSKEERVGQKFPRDNAKSPFDRVAFHD